NTGVINSSTNGDIEFTEVVGAMRVGGIVSTGGAVTLEVQGNAPSGNDLLLVNGAFVISAGGFVGLAAADDITMSADSLVLAYSTTPGLSSTVFILGDFGKAGGGKGSVISLAGLIFANAAFIGGGDRDNVISLTNVTAGTVTRVSTGGGINT